MRDRRVTEREREGEKERGRGRKREGAEEWIHTGAGAEMEVGRADVAAE